uniref:Uncharacterized protein n=1 Tax=Arion vulgaris TaxID=1028688 RepID=A0A0B6Y8L3_9EUPU
MVQKRETQSRYAGVSNIDRTGQSYNTNVICHKTNESDWLRLPKELRFFTLYCFLSEYKTADAYRINQDLCSGMTN